MQLGAHMSKCRELLWALRPVGAQQSVPDASQLCAMEGSIWRENRQEVICACNKAGGSDLCNLKFNMCYVSIVMIKA